MKRRLRLLEFVTNKIIEARHPVHMYELDKNGCAIGILDRKAVFPNFVIRPDGSLKKIWIQYHKGEIYRVFEEGQIAIG